MILREGDLWFATVYFEDKPNEKKDRPVLVLEDRGNIFRALKLTHHEVRSYDKYDYALQEWQEAGLRMPTTVRVAYLLEIPKRSLKFRVGHATEEDMNNIYYLLAQRVRFNERIQTLEESLSHISEDTPLREKIKEILKCGVTLKEAAEICEMEFGDTAALSEAISIAIEGLPVENRIVDGKAIFPSESDWEY